MNSTYIVHVAVCTVRLQGSLTNLDLDFGLSLTINNRRPYYY